MRTSFLLFFCVACIPGTGFETARYADGGSEGDRDAGEEPKRDELVCCKTQILDPRDETAGPDYRWVPRETCSFEGGPRSGVDASVDYPPDEIMDHTFCEDRKICCDRGGPDPVWNTAAVCAQYSGTAVDAWACLEDDPDDGQPICCAVDRDHTISDRQHRTESFFIEATVAECRDYGGGPTAATQCDEISANLLTCCCAVIHGGHDGRQQIPVLCTWEQGGPGLFGVPTECGDRSIRPRSTPYPNDKCDEDPGP